MKLITTETQRHREDENGKDPRTAPIIGAAIEVHRALGPGLLESAYEDCLCHELYLRGLAFERQVDLPVAYKGLHLRCGYKIDLIVEQEVVLELKANRNYPASPRGAAINLSEAFWKACWAADQFQYSRTD